MSGSEAQTQIPVDGLPFLDKHVAMIDAGADKVWSALLDTLDRTLSRRGPAVYARIVGCEPSTSSGARLGTEGATVPGFRVAAVEPGHSLVLEGRHRFSSYALCFALEEVPAGRTALRAESYACFPGVAGRAYRSLVVGTGAHVLLVRRLLSAVRRRAERHP